MLEIRDVTVAFGDKTVLQDCGFSLGAGEHLALMGPSGCGKTTLLRIALGLQMPDSGTVRCDSARPAAVFQEPRLLPWRTALENVVLPLKASEDARERALQWLGKLEIAEAAELYPDELSGGMQQRVSIARAMAVQPDFLVLDEAFKGLDEELRKRVLELLAGTLDKTAVLLATHSEEEARALGCRILRYKEGKFE
jgi:NitT/TauT family transport system ATP-binding protein